MRNILSSTFHAVPGQEAGWVSQFKAVFPFLTGLYDSIFISATPLTEATCVPKTKRKSLVEYLVILGAHCKVVDAGLGDNHRAALTMTLSETKNNRHCRIHYCDFDRILYWARYFPEELSAFVKLAEGFDAVFPYRRGLWDLNSDTPESLKNAWENHPLTQKATELVVNQAANWILNRITLGQAKDKCRIDPLATSQITSPDLTQTICRRSSFRGFPQAEWAAIILSEVLERNAGDLSKVECTAVNGLGFETFELYRHHRSLGDFRKAFADLQRDKNEAIKRISIAQGMMASFLQVFNRHGLIDSKSCDFVNKLNQELSELKERVETSPSGGFTEVELMKFYNRLRRSTLGLSHDVQRRFQF